MIGVQVEDVSRIKAFVICASTRRPIRTRSPTSCASWCKEHLRRYEYPHVVEFVEDLPRTPTGKVQRYKLREAEEVRDDAGGRPSESHNVFTRV